MTDKNKPPYHQVAKPREQKPGTYKGGKPRNGRQPLTAQPLCCPLCDRDQVYLAHTQQRATTANSLSHLLSCAICQHTYVL